MLMLSLSGQPAFVEIGVDGYPIYHTKQECLDWGTNFKMAVLAGELTGFPGYKSEDIVIICNSRPVGGREGPQSEQVRVE